MGKLSEHREGQRTCPTCHEAVSVTELYFNHKCQSIVKAVQGLQQILTGQLQVADTDQLLLLDMPHFLPDNFSAVLI